VIILLQMDSEDRPPTPVCPSCGNPMRFARAIPQDGRLPELWTFDCKECGLAVTEAKDSARMEKSQLASRVSSDRVPVIRRLLAQGLLVSLPDSQAAGVTDAAPKSSGSGFVQKLRRLGSCE
jgi:hypothetical protein